MMKYTIYGCITALVILAACKGKNKKDAGADVVAEDTVFVENADTALSAETIQSFNTAGFTDYLQKRSPAFDWKQFAMTTTWVEDSMLTVSFQPDQQFYAAYGRFLKYSPDSTQFIDLDSYNIDIRKDSHGRWVGTGSGPDTEVSLVDLKQGRKIRLLFMGPGGTVEDAFWIDRDNLVLMGTQESEDNNGKTLHVWKYHLPAKTYTLYELKDPSLAAQLMGQWRKERLKGVLIK